MKIRHPYRHRHSSDPFRCRTSWISCVDFHGESGVQALLFTLVYSVSPNQKGTITITLNRISSRIETVLPFITSMTGRLRMTMIPID